MELPTDILSEMVGRVWSVTSTDKARPILGGVHMKVENNTVRPVATDSLPLGRVRYAGRDLDSRGLL